MNSFGRIFWYVRPYLGLMWVSVAIIFAGTLFGLAAPWPFKFIIDTVLGSAPLPPMVARALGPLGQNKLHLLIAISAASVLIVLLENLLGVLSNYVTTR